MDTTQIKPPQIIMKMYGMCLNKPCESSDDLIMSISPFSLITSLKNYMGPFGTTGQKAFVYHWTRVNGSADYNQKTMIQVTSEKWDSTSQPEFELEEALDSSWHITGNGNVFKTK